MFAVAEAVVRFIHWAQIREPNPKRVVKVCHHVGQVRGIGGFRPGHQVASTILPIRRPGHRCTVGEADEVRHAALCGEREKTLATGIATPVVLTAADQEGLRRPAGIGDTDATATDVVPVSTQTDAARTEQHAGDLLLNRGAEIAKVVRPPGARGAEAIHHLNRPR